jgi:hypothetical protein
VFSLLLLFTSSCAILKRRVITKTETILQVDTLIIVKRDTIPIIKTGYIHDTIKIENSTSRVVAYFDVIQGKYVVALTGKPFTVPIKIKQHTMTITKVTEAKRKSNWFFWFFAGAVTMIILGLLIKLKIKK